MIAQEISVEVVVEEDYLNFAWWLAHYRIRAGLSQTELGRRSDFDHSYVSRLESGNRKPTRRAVERLSKELNLGQHETAHLMARAGFLSPASNVVTHEVLLDIDRLLDNPNQDTNVRKIALDQLNSIVWWLKLGAELEDKVTTKDFIGSSGKDRK